MKKEKELTQEKFVKLAKKLGYTNAEILSELSYRKRNKLPLLASYLIEKPKY